MIKNFYKKRLSLCSDEEPEENPDDIIDPPPFK